MTSLSNLYKYAKTGVASKDMTSFDKLLALQLAGDSFPLNTIEGVPPLNFKSDGSSLAACLILGATGGVGESTSNLFDSNDTYYYRTQIVSDSVWEYHSSLTGGVYRIPCKPNTTYTLSYSGDIQITIWRIKDTSSDSVPESGGSVPIAKVHATSVPSQKKTTFTTSDNAKYILFQSNSSQYDALLQTLTLNEGDIALPYEKFGYKIPITCGGETHEIYIDDPLYEEDTMSVEDYGITISTSLGSNTLSIGTTIQPSSVSITGNIK